MSIFMDLFYKIIGMTDALYDFLFTEIDLTLIGLGNVSLWEILSGSLIIIFLIFIITKKLLL